MTASALRHRAPRSRCGPNQLPFAGISNLQNASLLPFPPGLRVMHVGCSAVFAFHTLHLPTARCLSCLALPQVCRFADSQRDIGLACCTRCSDLLYSLSLQAVGAPLPLPRAPLTPHPSCKSAPAPPTISTPVCSCVQPSLPEIGFRQFAECERSLVFGPNIITRRQH